MQPRICASIVSHDPEAVKGIEPLADLFEVRIDLIGDSWQGLVKQLQKVPWIACNRVAEEGGNWRESEARRIEELLSALELGASIIDIELRTEKLKEIVPQIKRKAKCLVSYHDLTETPPLAKIQEIVRQELEAGADICKVATTARRVEDNLAVLQLIPDFPKTRVVSLAMGELGNISRVLCPLVGGDFTYASIASGKESAPGQITVKDLRQIYRMVTNVK